MGELLEKLSQRQFSELYLCLSYIHSVRHSIYVISHRGSLHKRKYAKLRKKLVSPLPHKLCIRLTTRNKSSLSLSHITTPRFFPEFCYFLFVEEAMQEYLPNGTAVVENSNEH